MYVAKINFSGKISQRSLSDYGPILEFVERKRKISGVILTINSGGGDATSSQILFNKIRKIDTIKPVYAYINGVGASGAYWMACACRKIYSLETSIVGSIGVISMVPNVKGLLDRIGVRVDIDKIGRYKDMNSPFGESDKEASEKYHEILEEIFSVFRNSVKERRKFTDEEIGKIATGEVFAPRKAMELRLIDGIGDIEAALDDMSRSYDTGKKTRSFSPKRPFVSRVIGAGAFSSLRDSVLDAIFSE
ncbi:signal peptide peptidase SppA [Oxyplasma meridianum]|uniref:Signal peptide peptidase SppA n=1 Tax=Oxyplasma meridianum TaxID=3073602 RepID=A0AAX4NHU2_9ARCH